MPNYNLHTSLFAGADGTLSQLAVKQCAPISNPPCTTE